MSSLANIPKQSYFSAQLQSPIEAAQTDDIILTDVPDYSPTGETVYFNILDSGRVETISATGWDSTTKELSGVTRAVATYTGETAVGYAHAAGVTVVLADDWKFWEAIQTAVNSKFDTAGGTITGPTAFSGASTTFRIPNLTTVQKNAIASPANGMLVYDTDLGEFQYYDGGAWQAVGTASVPNGSETVAGVWEGATVAQQGTATETGETGAKLVPMNKNLVKTSSGAGDENKIAVLGATGSLADGFINAAESGASKTVKSKASGALDDSLLTLTTAGDIPYSDGTDLQRLAIGAMNAVLRVNSGATAPRWVLSPLATVTAQTTYAESSAAETTFATVSVPANYIGTTGCVRMRIHCQFFQVTGGAVDAMTLRFKYGATTISTVVFINVTGGARSGAGYIDFFLLGAGATNSQVGQTVINVWENSGPSTNGYEWLNQSRGTSAEDSTGALNMLVTVQFEGADANNKIIVDSVITELI